MLTMRLEPLNENVPAAPIFNVPPVKLGTVVGWENVPPV
jgi:hypothetical protein